MFEEWKIIIGHPDYEISNFGRVRRLTDKYRNYKGRATSFKCMKSNSILKPKIKKGYCQVYLNTNGKRYYLLVHVLVITTFIGLPPTEEHEVAHWDGNKENNILSNLRWATKKENEADKNRHGTRPRKLSDIDIIEMRNKRNEGFSCRKIAKRFNISVGYTYRVCNKEVRKL